MAKYWLIWFVTSFTMFIVPETIALASGHVENTLSWSVWQMENISLGHVGWPWSWTAAHILFTGSFILVMGWLIGHFGWGIWR